MTRCCKEWDEGGMGLGSWWSGELDSAVKRGEVHLRCGMPTMLRILHPPVGRGDGLPPNDEGGVDDGTLSPQMGR